MTVTSPRPPSRQLQHTQQLSTLLAQSQQQISPPAYQFMLTMERLVMKTGEAEIKSWQRPSAR